MASDDDNEHVRLIEDALQRVANRCEGLFVACVGDEIKALLGAEGDIAAGFTASRRLGFARGRTAARNAMALAGGRRVAIPSTDAGLPLFPDGIAGSISHKYNWAIAAAVRTSSLRSVGLDLEDDDERDEEDLMARVCTDSERPLAARLRAAGHRSPATWIHSVKEASYKAHFAVHRLDFDYEDIELVLDDDETFHVARIDGVTKPMVRGVYARSGSWLVSLAIISR